MKKNNSGITLMSLIITIIVLLILASVTIYSGIATVRSAKLTKFTTELKMMQQKVNELYDSYSNNKSVTVNGIEYVGKGQSAEEGEEAKSGVQDIGKTLDASFESSVLEEVFSSNGSEITDKTGYMYYDTALLEELGLENMEYEFFVNIEKRSVVSTEGYNDNGQIYYTLDQVPDGVYNVEYDPTVGIPTFDVEYKNIGNNKWKITISNIQYDGYINKWEVKYQIDGQGYWNTTEDLSFVVNEPGVYKIYIEKGDIKSAEKSKALGVPELTPEVADKTSFTRAYGVIEIEFLSGTSYNTTTTPNHPIIKEGMTAITYNETTGEAINVSDDSGTDWYSYVETTDSDMTDGGTTDGGNSHWANAKVTVGGVESYFVWIPRYAYRIIYFDTEPHENEYRVGTLTEEEALEKGYILGYSDARGIVDSEGKTPRDLQEPVTSIAVGEKKLRTHPAFEDGSSTGYTQGEWSSKLEGIWVAKYEASQVSGTTTPKFESGKSSWRSITIGNMYTYSQAYNATLNSHLMKNSEWGVVAYLTESKYGRNGTAVSKNSSSSYYTAGESGATPITNKLQSTTGNEYGIFDTVGGSYESVAAYIADLSQNYGNSFASTDNTTNNKTESTPYATVYQYDANTNSLTDNYNTNINKIFGDATIETSTTGSGTTSWYSASSYFVSIFLSSNFPFFDRGGSYLNSSTGSFNFNRYDGDSNGNSGFRVCLAVQ